MARDIFTIPASGAGVERLFNSARDIYYYRRGRLNKTAIQDLIIYRCISEFDLDITDLAGESDGEEEPIAEERQQAALRQEARLGQFTPVLISDNEEDKDEDEDEDDEGEGESEDRYKVNFVPFGANVLSATSRPSQRALGKRRQSVDRYGEEEDETKPQLPRLPQDKEGYSQMRTSGRARKRPRNLDNYDVTYK
jgi:hypothetical protein